MFRTVIANISRRKLRLLGTSLAVLLGVMFTSGTLVLTTSLGSAFDSLFTNVYANTAAVAQSNVKVTGGLRGSNAATRGDLGTDVVSRIAGIQGVATAEGNISGYTQVIKKNGKALGNPNQGPPTLGGNWLIDPTLNPFQLVSGRAPQQPGQVVIDKATSKTTGYTVGSMIPLLTPTGRITAKVVGVAKFGNANGAGGATNVSFTTAEAQRILGRPGRFDEIRIAAKPGVTAAQVVANVQAAHIPNVEVETGLKAAADAKKAATAFLSFFSIFLLVFAAIALLVGAFIIANTFSILVAQRTKELALLRAIGASRKQVLMSVVAEAFVVGLIASAVGLAIGYGVAAILESLLLGNSGLGGGAQLTPSTVVASFAIGIVITVLSALLPARRASMIAPIEAMRGSAIEDTSKGRIRAVIGLVLLVITALLLLWGVSSKSQALIGFGALTGLSGAVVFGPVLASWLAIVIGKPMKSLGMAGTLGQQNVLRNPKRTASTASALMIGATLVCAISVFAASALASINKLVDTRFHGAVVVSSTGNGLPISDITRLESNPAFPTVAAMFYAPVSINGQGVLVSASNPKALSSLVDMETTAGNIATLGPNDVAIAATRAKSSGWTIGSQVHASFLNGTSKTLTVRAIYRNRLIGQGFFVNLDAVKASLPVPLAQIAFLNGRPGVSPTILKDQVNQILAANPTAKVQTNAEFKASSAAQMDTFLNIVYAMLLLAVIIAFIGIVNTLGLSIMERTRELGLLRAVGMTRKQLRTTVRVEALLIALTGTIIGIVLGTAIGSALMKSFGPDQALTGFSLPVTRLVVVLVAGVVVGFVAAILPARRAARLNPLEALATE